MFRETTAGDFNLARQALESSLRDLFDRKKLAQAERWISKFLKTFEAHAQRLKDQDAKGKINLEALLFPALGRMKEHQQELDSFLEKYVILPADKCRGNYIVVCKNLYIKQCVSSLHHAPKYQRVQIFKEDLSARLQQQVAGLIHHVHLALLLEKGEN